GKPGRAAAIASEKAMRAWARNRMATSSGEILRPRRRPVKRVLSGTTSRSLLPRRTPAVAEPVAVLVHESVLVVRRPAATGGALGEALHDVDGDEDPEIPRGGRIVLPRTGRLEDGGAPWHRDHARVARHVLLAVRHRSDARLELLVERLDRLHERSPRVHGRR